MTHSQKEEAILISNDNSVVLTTHRVLHKSKNKHSELLLKDFISYEIIRKRVQYYKVLFIFLLLISVAIGVWAYFKNEENNEFLYRNSYGLDEVISLKKR